MAKVELRQARIRTAHLTRSVVYSSDSMIFVSLIAFMWVSWEFLIGWGRVRGISALRYSVGPYVLLAAAVGMPVLFSRLAIAARKYLRVPHGIAMIVCSQIIVSLALFKMWLMWMGM